MVTKFLKRKDKGFCPTYHSDDGIMFWVQDRRINHFNGGGEYEYDFMCRKENSKATMTKGQLKKFVIKNKAKLIRSYSDYKIDLYSDGKNDYIYYSQEKTLKTIYAEHVIRGGFASFKECLEYAEKYISERYCKEVEQLTLDDFLEK